MKYCPKCEIGEIVQKRGKYGSFFGCNRFPSCDYIDRPQKDKSKLSNNPADRWAREHGVSLEPLIN
ncbi:MAG: topoisomerase DNA-binding C4 zinc finger domain-containing protein [Parcubacteria group bacterium]